MGWQDRKVRVYDKLFIKLVIDPLCRYIASLRGHISAVYQVSSYDVDVTNVTGFVQKFMYLQNTSITLFSLMLFSSANKHWTPGRQHEYTIKGP